MWRWMQSLHKLNVKKKEWQPDKLHRKYAKMPPQTGGIFFAEKTTEKNLLHFFAINQFHLPLPSQKIGVARCALF